MTPTLPILQAALGSELIATFGNPAVAITHVAHDSRAIGPGGLFVATHTDGHASQDGHAFIAQAIAQGATVIVAESPQPPDYAPQVAWLQVHNGLIALARLAAAWHHDPAATLDVLAVTGTNGKTTTTWLLDAIFTAAALPTGLISTVAIRVADRLIPAAFTTPPALDFQALLATMRDAGLRAALVEASSHGLAQHRLDCRVAVAGFTNLTRDHLDYHGTMEAYEHAKLRLFTELAERAVIVTDAPAGQRMAAAFQARIASSDIHLITISTCDEPASLSAGKIHSDLDGLSAEIAVTPAVAAAFNLPSAFTLKTPLIGRHNLENALVAFGMATLAGIPPATTLTALTHATGAPGRLQAIPGPAAQPKVFVDYAHSPDALVNVLTTLAPLTHARGGRLLVVFGAGGDRDHGKRPAMAAACQAHADRAFVTSDNPRTEAPERIIDDIVAGFTPSPTFTYTRLSDRAAAIAAAIAEAGPRDTVLIAGKGHEDYQIIGHTKHPFDDATHARAALTGGHA